MKGILNDLLQTIGLHEVRCGLIPEEKDFSLQERHLSLYEIRDMSGHRKLLLIELIRHCFSHLPGRPESQTGPCQHEEERYAGDEEQHVSIDFGATFGIHTREPGSVPFTTASSGQ
jgi:hypothetical protein